MPVSLPSLVDMTIRTPSNQEFESQLRQAYTTSGSSWWMSREGFRVVPDTNAQTTAADDGRRFWAVDLARPEPVTCVDIEPEDL